MTHFYFNSWTIPKETRVHSLQLCHNGESLSYKVEVILIGRLNRLHFKEVGYLHPQDLCVWEIHLLVSLKMCVGWGRGFLCDETGLCIFCRGKICGCLEEKKKSMNTFQEGTFPYLGDKSRCLVKYHQIHFNMLKQNKTNKTTTKWLFVKAERRLFWTEDLHGKDLTCL